MLLALTPAGWRPAFVSGLLVGLLKPPDWPSLAPRLPDCGRVVSSALVFGAGCDFDLDNPIRRLGPLVTILLGAMLAIATMGSPAVKRWRGRAD